MRQALNVLILSLGLLVLPTSALADGHKSHSQHKFSSDHYRQHKWATDEHRSKYPHHNKSVHQKLHRIEKHRHYSGHNFKQWKARKHYYAHKYYHHCNHYPLHPLNHRQQIKHQHHSHSRHDSDYLEWLGIVLLLDEALDDDYR